MIFVISIRAILWLDFSFVITLRSGWFVDHDLPYANKGHFSFFPTENRKRKKKVCMTIENKYPSDELVSSLDPKIKNLEEEVWDMREQDELLFSVNNSLNTNMDVSSVASQVTFQDNPPPLTLLLILL